MLVGDRWAIGWAIGWAMDGLWMGYGWAIPGARNLPLDLGPPVGWDGLRMGKTRGKGPSVGLLGASLEPAGGLLRASGYV